MNRAARAMATVLPNPVRRAAKHFLLGQYVIQSYSQEGEDMILRRAFDGMKSCGFYVDVGAYHPQSLSNTYYFYRRGWSGINIDAMPGSMRSFEKLRPRDINVEAAIARVKERRTYFVFNEPNLNSFDEQLSRERDRPPLRIVREQAIYTRTLRDVLDEYLPSGQTINFLSVDVEGLDLEVLESNDWSLYRPGYVLVEFYAMQFDDIQGTDSYRFLINHDYEFFAKTVNTVIFRDRNLPLSACL